MVVVAVIVINVVVVIVVVVVAVIVVVVIPNECWARWGVGGAAVRSNDLGGAVDTAADILAGLMEV